MKNLWSYALLLVSLAACACVVTYKYGCTIYENGNVCIDMQAVEPIQYGEPITLTITVTSATDIAGLKIFLYSSPPTILMEGVNGWVENGINWAIDIVANQPQVFTRRVLLPEKDGNFQILCSADTGQLHTAYSFYVHQEGGVSTLYYPNTPIPYTQQPLPNTSPELLETLHAIPTPTRYPTLVPKPTSTSTPTSPAYPPPASPTSVWDAPGDTPYP
jgi:hypothetical protein